MNLRAVATALAALSLNCQPAVAQPQVRSVNPQAIEFDAPTAVPYPAELTEYRVDFFVAGSDTRQDFPIKSVELGPQARRDDGTVRVEVMPALSGVPDGQYIATISSMDRNGPVAQSEPSQMFVLSHGTVFPSAQQAPELERRERLWTKVGFAIIGGLLLVPFLVR